MRSHLAAATINHLNLTQLEVPEPPTLQSLAPSDFQFFPALKKTLKGQHLTTNANVKAAICTFMHRTHTFINRYPQACEVLKQIHEYQWRLENKRNNASFYPHLFSVF